MEFTRQDSDKIARIDTMLSDIHEHLGSMIEEAAEVLKGANRALITTEARFAALETAVGKHDVTISHLSRAIIGVFVGIFALIIGVFADVLHIK